MAYALGGSGRRSARNNAIKTGAQWIEWAMIAPASALMLVFLVLPFGLSFWLSLTNQRLIPRPIPTKFIGLRNFERILSDSAFWNALGNVIEFVVMVVPVQCGFALAIALILNQKLPFRNVFRSLFFLPFITSMVVVSVIWTTLYQYPTGPLNELLSIVTFGLAGPIDWLGNPSSAMPSIVILSAWQAFGFQMVVYLAGLQNIPHTLYEAARIDGANAFQRFWHITMPGLRQTHVFVLIITTIQAFKLYTQIALITRGGPNGATDTLVYYMVTAGFTGQKIGYAAAVAVILFVIVVAISLGQRFIMRDRT